MFRLLAMFLAAKRAEEARRAETPWTCPECAHACPVAKARRHLSAHRARTVSADPLVVELCCHPARESLPAALVELRARWPDRKFTLLPSTYGRTSASDALQLFTILAIAD